MPCDETGCICKATQSQLIATGLGIFGHDKDGNCRNPTCGHHVLNHTDSSAADASKKPRIYFSALPSAVELPKYKDQVPRSVHVPPPIVKFVGRQIERQHLIEEIRKGYRGDSGSHEKTAAVAFEYGTMSGAGKSTWGFEIEKVLKESFDTCAVKRVSLNFNGGSGAMSDACAFSGSQVVAAKDAWVEGTAAARGKIQEAIEAIEVATSKIERKTAKHNLNNARTFFNTDKRGFESTLANACNSPLAQLLFARGSLQTSFDEISQLFDFAKIGTSHALDLLCEQALLERKVSEVSDEKTKDPDDVIIYVHLDEAALLHPAIVKSVIYCLLSYNTLITRKGWVIPVMTHTAPLNWDPDLSQFDMISLPLYPLTLEQMRTVKDWTEEVNSDRLLMCTGGHARLLQILLANYKDSQPQHATSFAAGYHSVFTQAPHLFTAAGIFNMVGADEKRKVLTKIILQQKIKSHNGMWPQLYSNLWRSGILFCTLHRKKGKLSATISTPLPYLLSFLEATKIDITDYLRYETALFDPSKALEVLVVLWAACTFSSIQNFKGVIDFNQAVKNRWQIFGVSPNASQPQLDGYGGYQLGAKTDEDEEEKVEESDAEVEGDPYVSVVIQTKRAQSNSAEQERKEVENFVKFALDHTKGNLVAIFITDRKSEKLSGYQDSMQELLAPRGLFAIYRDWRTLGELISPGTLAL